MLAIQVHRIEFSGITLAIFTPDEDSFLSVSSVIFDLISVGVTQSKPSSL